MVLTMGLHLGIHASHQHTVVQHLKLPSDCPLLIWNGGNDTTENFAQRHRQIQSNRQRRGRTGTNLAP